MDDVISGVEKDLYSCYGHSRVMVIIMLCGVTDARRVDDVVSGVDKGLNSTHSVQIVIIVVASSEMFNKIRGEYNILTVILILH